MCQLGLAILMSVLVWRCEDPGGEGARRGFLRFGENDTVVVRARGGLRLRSAPDLESAAVLSLPDGARVSVIEEVLEPVVIGRWQNNWVHVQSGTQDGYVFGAYLSYERVLKEHWNPSRTMKYRLMNVSRDEDDCYSDRLGGFFSNCRLVIVDTDGTTLHDHRAEASPGFASWYGIQGWVSDDALLTVLGSGDGGGVTRTASVIGVDGEVREKLQVDSWFCGLREINGLPSLAVRRALIYLDQEEPLAYEPETGLLQRIDAEKERTFLSGDCSVSASGQYPAERTAKLETPLGPLTLQPESIKLQAGNGLEISL